MTGLSADQLREWTGRRGLIVPDVPARGKGTQARFSWQTLLLLRIAASLKEQAHVGLEAYREQFFQLQARLNGQAFHALWGAAVVFVGGLPPSLRPIREVEVGGDRPVLVVALQPHLDAILQGLGAVETPAQLPLFRAIAVR